MKILIIGIVASGKTVLAQKLEHSQELEEYIKNECSKT